MTSRIARSVVVAVLAVAALPACGSSSTHEDGHGADATPASERAGATEPRVIDVTMTEFAFSPSVIEVADGEKVTLRFHNVGAVTHEAVIADAAAQADHAAAMAEADGGHMHDMSGIKGLVVLEAGLSDGATFVAEDGLLIVCHQPGHEAAGMTASIVLA